jgi:fructose PTS system EIIBC or EIIC component
MFNNLKKHAMTAISYLIPLVVAAGFLLAIGNIMGGSTIENIKDGFSFADCLTSMGSYGLGLLPMIVAAGISFSIADKPGIAPGIIVGMISKGIGAGFLGGFIGGYIAGYITKLIKDKVKLPVWAEGLMPTLIIPFLASLLSGLVMYFIIGTPIIFMTDFLTNYVSNLDSSSRFLYGIIIGILSSIDYGGAINKVVFAFVLGLQSEGINEPITVLILASMVTPFGMTFAYFISKLFKKNIYTKVEVETLKTAFPMGICEITEGCLPIVMNDIIRCVISTAVGGAIGGGLSMLWGCDSKIPASGMFAMPTMSNPFQFFIALIIGSLATGVMLVILKKSVDPNEEKQTLDENDEEDVDLSSIKLS